jgi:hypothetical protein
MSNTVVQRRLQIVIDESGADQALKRLQASTSKLEKEIEKGTQAGKDMTAELTKLGQQKARITELEGVLSGKLQPTLRQTEAAVRKLRSELANMSKDTPGYAEKFKAFRAAEDQLNRMKTSLTGIRQGVDATTPVLGKFGVFAANVMAQAVSFVVTGVSQLFSNAIDIAAEAELSLQRLSNRLRNLGQESALPQLRKQAEDLAKTFGFFDDDDLFVVFENLATYGKLSTEQIQELTPVIVDFASNTGQSFSEASTTIIKALEGQGRELKRFGIDLKDANTPAERYKLVMTDLYDKVRGSAETYAESSTGSLARVRQELKNTSETIGEIVLPAWVGFLEAIRKGLDGIIEIGRVVKLTIDNLGNLPLALRQRNAQIREAAGQQFIQDQVTASLQQFNQLTLEEQEKSLNQLRELRRENNRLMDEDERAGNKQSFKLRNERLAYLNEEIGAKINALETNKKLAADQKSLNDKMDKDEQARAAALRRRSQSKSPAQLEAERRKKELEELAKDLQRIERELFLNTLEPYEKRIAQIADRYQKLFEIAGENLVLREKVLKNMLTEINQFWREINKASTDVIAPPVDEAAIQRQMDLQLELIQADNIRKAAEKKNAKEVSDARIRSIDAAIKFDVEGTFKALKEKEAAEREFLRIQEREAKKSAIAQGESVEEVEAEFRQKRQQQETEFLKSRVGLFVEYLDQALLAFQGVSDVFSAFEQSKINQINERYRTEQNQLDNMLKQKLISEQDYYFRSKNLQEKADRDRLTIQKREFKRNQVMQIGQAISAGALAVLSTLQAKPGPLDVLSLGAFRAIQIGIITATTAAQIAKIASEKPPTFAKGGLLPKGSSHAEGGIALYDNRTGRNVGEIEGGEPIISRGVYRSNKSIVDALLAKGFNRDFTPLPGWHTQQPMTLNISRLQRQHRRFADGGILPDGAGAEQPFDISTTGNNNAQTFQRLESTMQLIAQRLSEPIYANVVYGQFEAAEDAINNIRSSGMIN